MFKPLAMQYISLKLLTEEVPLVAEVLANRGLFNPEKTEVIAEYLPEHPGENFQRLFSLAHSRFEKISTSLSFSPPDFVSHRIIELIELKSINAQLGEIWQQLSKLEEQLHRLNEQKIYLTQLLEMLKRFRGLDVDLSLFQESARFLNLHIGTIPVENLNHLIDTVVLAAHFIDIFHRDEYTAYVVVAGPLEHQEKIRAVLEHAEFKTLTIPPEFKSHPQQVYLELMTQLDQLQEQSQTLMAMIQTLAKKNKNFLEQAYQMLNCAAAYAKLTETLRGRGQLALTEGWIPREELAELETLLKKKLKSPFVLTSRQPLPSEYLKVPSLIRHHRFLAPFIALVKNYGTPRYGEFDPTILFAFTFILMFGCMFGDVGHGVLIALAGGYWRDKLKTFTPFFIAAGLSSVFFGFLYGSVFGFEEVLLPALWMSPIHHPHLMLIVALYWGMGFILLAMLITFVNRWQEGHYAMALFNSTGLTGILLYIGGFYAIQTWLVTNTFDTLQQLAVLSPLLIILIYKGYENKRPLGERLLVTLIEGLESLINYLANTLSFLRVAAFSLNHAALAIAVFTLANMMDTPADWLIIILGNLFIVILEGAIVTIQVLRLEYYEGFSRFFSGDGRTFQPLRMGIE